MSEWCEDSGNTHGSNNFVTYLNFFWVASLIIYNADNNLCHFWSPSTSTWTFLTLDKNWHSLDQLLLPHFLVHVVIEWPPKKSTYLVKNRQHAIIIKLWPLIFCKIVIEKALKFHFQTTRKFCWQLKMSGWIQATMQQNTISHRPSLVSTSSKSHH